MADGRFMNISAPETARENKRITFASEGNERPETGEDNLPPHPNANEGSSKRPDFFMEAERQRPARNALLYPVVPITMGILCIRSS